MSDEGTGQDGPISLEADQNASIVQMTPAGAPTAVAGTDEDEPAGTVEGSQGVKFVPLQAVKEARRLEREAREELKAARERVAEAEHDRAQLAQLRGYVDQARPIIEQLRQRPDLLTAVQQPAKPAPVDAPVVTDAEAAALAKDLDLYLPDGTPDLGRAHRVARHNAAVAEAAAGRAMAPLQEREAVAQSGRLKMTAAQQKDASGQTVSPEALEAIWSQVPAALSARPEVASVLYYAAKGYEAHHNPRTRSATPPALQTANLGGAPKPASTFSDLDERMAKAAGISKKDYQDNAARFKQGGINVLE